MENENEVILDTPNETVEETVETPAETTEETLETESEVDVEKVQATNKKLFERAKKAEAEVKLLKSKTAPAQASSSVDIDERIIKSQGMSDELLKQLRKVAQVTGVSLIEAQTDSLFVAMKDKFDKEQKQKKAALGASRGSGSPAPRKDFKTKGLTADEHKAMVKSLQ